MSCDVMEARCGLLLFALLTLPLPLAPCPVFERVRRRSVTLPSRLAGGVGGGPLSVTGLCRGFARRFRWRESGPPPGLPRKRGGGGFRRLAGGFAAGAGWRSVSVMRASSFGAKGRDGVPVLRAFRVCGRAGPRARIAAARFVRLIARARRHTHLARPFPPGCFSRPPAVAFCRNAERRPRKPPLSTFILHHIAKCQARTGTKNETAGDIP